MKEFLTQLFNSVLAIVVIAVSVLFQWTWLAEIYIIWAIVVAYAQIERLRKTFQKTLPSNILLITPLKKKIYKPFNVIFAFALLIALILMLIIDDSSLIIIYVLVTITLSEQMDEVIKFIHQFIHPRCIYINNSSLYFYQEGQHIIRLPEITRIELYDTKAEIFANNKKTTVYLDNKMEEKTFNDFKDFLTNAGASASNRFGVHYHLKKRLK